MHKIRKIADHYGLNNQLSMLIEESAEFTQAVSKYRRGIVKDMNNIKEELSDILVVAEQLKYLLGESEIEEIMNSKIDRQLDRIRKESICNKIEKIKIKVRGKNND